MMKSIILASQSPRRKQLLEAANFDLEIITEHSNEDFPAEMPITEVPVFIALNKALAVKNKINNLQKPIVAADTIVAINNEILGKPSNRDEAILFLKKLSGNVHKVITGVAIIFKKQEILFCNETCVSFYALTNEQIEFYVDNYKPYDKAGAYAIQEWIGMIGIEKIDGDFYNVMGLPISIVAKELNLLF